MKAFLTLDIYNKPCLHLIITALIDNELFDFNVTKQIKNTVTRDIYGIQSNLDITVYKLEINNLCKETLKLLVEKL